MSIEELKVIMPVITFILGILSIPIVDKLRNFYQKRENLKLLNEELTDETKWLGERIKKMHLSLETVDSLKLGEEKKGNLRYAPRKTTVRFIERVLDSSYADLTHKQRSTLKSIEVQIDAINEYADKIKELSNPLEKLDELAKLQKSFIYTTCCLRYCMQYFTEKERLTFIEEITDKEAIELQLSELELSRDYDSLITKKSQPFTPP